MALPRGHGQPKMVPWSLPDLRPIGVRPFGSDLKRSKMAPRGLQASFSAPKASKSAPRAIQEAFSCHHAPKRQSNAILYRFWYPKIDPGTLKINELYWKNNRFWRNRILRSSCHLDSILEGAVLPFGSLRCTSSWRCSNCSVSLSTLFFTRSWFWMGWFSHAKR